MTTERLIKLFREEFYAAIGRQNNWFPADIKLEFERSIVNTFAKAADEETEK
jgi:hypothetical protein